VTALDRNQIERAREADILAVAQRYTKLKRACASEFVGACPACGGHDRFAVNTKKRVWNCRRCGNGGDAIRLLQHAIGATFVQAIEMLSGEKWTPTTPLARDQRRDDDNDGGNDRNGLFAARIWDHASPIKGTLAEHYLVNDPPIGRGIDTEQITDIDDVLRFEARCPFAGQRLPCLVALVRNAVTDEPMGIVRTALDSNGQKIERRALGPKKGGAIKLWADAAVTTGLVVGEGLETTAAAATRVEHQHTLLQPAWALVDSNNLRDFQVLSGIEALTILVDNDQNGVGQAAANICTQRWLAVGRFVSQLIPSIVGDDFNNIAVASGGVR
jgi:phage/plasmid primase-like uncharacterized protein